MAKSRSSGNRGVILITTIIVMVFLSVLGMSMLAFLFSTTSYAQVQLDRMKAIYLAESGIAKAIWELRYDIDPDGDGTGNVKKVKLGDGVFWAKHDFQSSTITGVGEVNRLRRTLQIKYSSI